MHSKDGDNQGVILAQAEQHLPQHWAFPPAATSRKKELLPESRQDQAKGQTLAKGKGRSISSLYKPSVELQLRLVQ